MTHSRSNQRAVLRSTFVVLLWTSCATMRVAHAFSSWSRRRLDPSFTSWHSNRGHAHRRAAVIALATAGEEEAERMLAKVRAMRQEIATLEGRSLADVEEEAQTKRENRERVAAQRAQEQSERRQRAQQQQRQQQRVDGRFLTVPETFDDQVALAKTAVERAFRDGLTRQTVRFALIPRDEVLLEDRQWPGGARQMYREAAGPLTQELLRQLRPTSNDDDENAPRQLVKPPVVKAQDIWDFDGSALITAEASTGPKQDVQALVLPNTDTKYIKDIATIDKAMGETRLFLLVNPFWRNVDSWGFNLLAPNAKRMAQTEIFDRGYQETFFMLKTSVRGEDCVSMKVYPYDWQLYAYADDEYWPNQRYPIHLGSTTDEPTSADFAQLLEKREEFKLSRNMRQIQRLVNRDE